MTLSEIKRVLQELNLKPLKQLGQNFLFEPSICQSIVDCLQCPSESLVYEIGPGLGVLTEPLLNKGYTLKAFEIDKGYCEFLKVKFPKEKFSNFELVEGDALKNLPQYSAPTALIGNLPYNITTPLLIELAFVDPLPDEIVITIQKEVGDRLVARHNTHDYGATSVFLQSLFDIKIEKILPADVFYPPPRVTSAVLHLEKKKELPEQIQRKKFYSYLRKGFSQRRKKLKNVLPHVLLEERPQHLDLKQWWELYQNYGRDI